MKIKSLPKLILFILVTEGAGLIGSIFTFQSIPTWYQTLNKPSFTPPGWVFGPVWTILYFLMGIAAYLVWQKGKSKKVSNALKLFAIQLILNSLWSIIFFGLKNPTLALIEILVLVYFVAKTVKAFKEISKEAGLLMMPYLLWSTFATILTLAIVNLN